jgi:hypothetical protein
MTSQHRPLTSQCTICGKQEDLSRCGMCKVQRYCGRLHQEQDRATHKTACIQVKKTRAAMEEEERKLRDIPPDLFMPANVFEEKAGIFWNIYETRSYMRSRYALVEALIKVNTYDSIQAAYEHLRDMLRLCRGDNMGVRHLVPSLLLRLGRDQDAYDFIKWYGTQGEDASYDWGRHGPSISRRQGRRYL